MPDAGPIETVADLRARVAGFRAAGERVALVPTMGALHAGHLSLVERAKASADRVVVSIFVNPTQFAPHEDLAAYPRALASDLALLSAAGGVDLVYAPDVAQMYPVGNATTITVGGPALGLESDARPHFFAGVATVVTKLMIQCAPDVAVFGEKDYQQLVVIRRLSADLSLPVEILSGATVRERDGLALSSRNVYLTPVQRAIAPVLHASISAAASAIASGGNHDEALAVTRAKITAAGFAIDYVALREASTLGTHVTGPGRILVAARLGTVRLIDNVEIA